MAAPALTLPIPLDLGPAFAILNAGGLAVFAASGALAAARRRLSLVTFFFFATVTGTGGGTVRDLLIGAPVFWMHDGLALALCWGTALAVWCTPRAFWRDRALDWLDAVGLAAYAVYGAAKALGYGVPPLPAIGMGVVTACMGGILRDVLAGEESYLLSPEIYVSAAALASGLYVALAWLGMAPAIAMGLAAAAGFGLRALAIARGLALPTYRG